MKKYSGSYVSFKRICVLFSFLSIFCLLINSFPFLFVYIFPSEYGAGQWVSGKRLAITGESFPESAKVLGRKKDGSSPERSMQGVSEYAWWVMKASNQKEPGGISMADVHYVNDIYASGNAIGW